MPKFKKPSKSSSPLKSNKRVTSGSTQHMKPIFSFEKMQRGTGFSIECCDKDNQAAIATKLFELSQLTWADLSASGRHGLGWEKIEKSAIKAPLPPLTEDVTIYAFRYNGKAPMLGYRDGRVFYVLLVDHNFTAYDHG